MAHLRIAELLLGHLTDLDAAQFAVGSIAPDAALRDEKDGRFIPPPTVSHFQKSEAVHKEIADLDFYRRYLASIAPGSLDFSFRLGYFLHLVTDSLWTTAVGVPTQTRWQAEFAADEDFIWEVKKDWYGLDHRYVRASPACLFWKVLLTAEFEASELDFLPRSTLERHLRHVKTYYSKGDERTPGMMARPFIYLSGNEMDRFVEESAAALRRLHAVLWPAPPDLTGHASALELLAT